MSFRYSKCIIKVRQLVAISIIKPGLNLGNNIDEISQRCYVGSFLDLCVTRKRHFVVINSNQPHRDFTWMCIVKLVVYCDALVCLCVHANTMQFSYSTDFAKKPLWLRIQHCRNRIGRFERFRLLRTGIVLPESLHAYKSCKLSPRKCRLT